MPIKTKFRTWQLIATLHTVKGSKDNFSFKINRLPDFEAALRAGKAEVNQREGVEEWDQAYENEALK